MFLVANLAYPSSSNALTPIIEDERGEDGY